MRVVVVGRRCVALLYQFVLQLWLLLPVVVVVVVGVVVVVACRRQSVVIVVVIVVGCVGVVGGVVGCCFRRMLLLGQNPRLDSLHTHNQPPSMEILHFLRFPG